MIALQLAFERQEVGIPDDDILISELEAYEATRLPSGRWRYSAPEGMHDDTVIALALAYEAANRPVGVASRQAKVRGRAGSGRTVSTRR